MAAGHAPDVLDFELELVEALAAAAAREPVEAAAEPDMPVDRAVDECEPLVAVEEAAPDEDVCSKRRCLQHMLGNNLVLHVR